MSKSICTTGAAPWHPNRAPTLARCSLVDVCGEELRERGRCDLIAGPRHMGQARRRETVMASLQHAGGERGTWLECLHVLPLAALPVG